MSFEPGSAQLNDINLFNIFIYNLFNDAVISWDQIAPV
jgi:hypothetical protein